MMRTCAGAGRRSVVGTLLSLAALVLSLPTHGSEPFPSRPVRLLVPFSAGTQADVVARTFATPLAADLGRPVVVDNRPGATGNIAADAVARATADGHTLLLAGVTQTIQASTAGTIAVDPVRAFAPVIKLTHQPLLFAVHPDFAVRTVAELVAKARSEPGTISYSTSGVGSSGHVAASLLASGSGIEMVHVPYASTSAIWRDALAGTVPLTINPVSATLPYLRSGQLRALAVTGPTRSKALPGTPTFAEAGYAGVDIGSWYGILATAGTPPEVIRRLHDALARILRQPEVAAQLDAMGLEPVGTSGEILATEIRNEVARWKPVVDAMGLRDPSRAQ